MMLNLFTNKKIKSLEDENISLLNQISELKSELEISLKRNEDLEHNNVILLENAEELRNQISSLEKIIKSQNEDFNSFKAKGKIEPAKKTNKTSNNTKLKKETTSRPTRKAKK